MVGLCRFNISWIFGIWKRQHFLHLKTINRLLFSMIIFYVLYHISLNFQHTQSYYIPKFCKCYKDSAGLDRFALAALERELWPRRPVHFFMPHSLHLAGKFEWWQLARGWKNQLRHVVESTHNTLDIFGS